MSEAQIDIGLDRRKLQTELKGALGDIKEFAESADKSLRVLSNLGAAGAAAIGLEFVYDKLKEFVGLAARNEEAALRFNTVMQSMGDEVGTTAERMKLFAYDLHESTTASVGQIKQAELSMVEFGNIHEKVMKRAIADSADLAVLWGESLPGAARRLGFALSRPEMAARYLRTAGVVFSSAEQQKLQQFSRYGDTESRDQARDLILSKIEKAAPGLAEQVANSPSGQWEKMKQEMEESGAEIGKAFLRIAVDLKPIFRDIADSVKTSAGYMRDVIDYWHEQLPSIFGQKTPALDSKSLGNEKYFPTTIDTKKYDAEDKSGSMWTGYENYGPEHEKLKQFSFLGKYDHPPSSAELMRDHPELFEDTRREGVGDTNEDKARAMQLDQYRVDVSRYGSSLEGWKKALATMPDDEQQGEDRTALATKRAKARYVMLDGSNSFNNLSEAQKKQIIDLEYDKIGDRDTRVDRNSKYNYLKWVSRIESEKNTVAVFDKELPGGEDLGRPFQAKFESGEAMSKRIQEAAASRMSKEDDPAEKTATNTELMVKSLDNIDKALNPHTQKEITLLALPTVWKVILGEGGANH